MVMGTNISACKSARAKKLCISEDVSIASALHYKHNPSGQDLSVRPSRLIWEQYLSGFVASGLTSVPPGHSLPEH